MSETINCKHCGKEPNFIKHCFNNMAYFNFRCRCKETPLRRSYEIAEKEWENIFQNTEPNKMPQVKAADGAYII